MTLRQKMLRNLLLTDFFPGVRDDVTYRLLTFWYKWWASKGAPVVWGASAAMHAAFESALPAETEELPGPEVVAPLGH